MKPILLYCDDLFFAGRIESVLRHLGYAPQTAMSLQAAEDTLKTLQPALVIVRFDKEKPEPFTLAEIIKRLPGAPPVLGFMPHVLIPETRARAKESGCDLLVPNSSITQKLPQILARLLPDDGTPADIAAASEYETED